MTVGILVDDGEGSWNGMSLHCDDHVTNTRLPDCERERMPVGILVDDGDTDA